MKKVESLLFAEPTGLAKARLDKKTLSLFKNMEKVSQPLGKIANIGVGIQESLVRGERISRFVVGNAENSNHVPVLRGREISKFFIKWEGKYINYGPHLAYRGSPEVFQGEKILYQNIRNETLPTRLVAALDKKSFFPKNSLSIIWNPKPPFSLLYLLGLLNCRLVNSWFKCHYQSFHVTVTQVRTIPIPTGTPETRRILESLVEEILSQDPKELIFGELLDSLERAVVSCYFPGGRVRNSDLIKSS
ncbi:hypothetical protein HYY75_13095 [bacterium]|nr:hypothetical protein [bacterium]